jgi:hypothetical protein
MAKLKSEITKAIADRLSIIEALLPQLEKGRPKDTFYFLST